MEYGYKMTLDNKFRLIQYLNEIITNALKLCGFIMTVAKELSPVTFTLPTPVWSPGYEVHIGEVKQNLVKQF